MEDQAFLTVVKRETVERGKVTTVSKFLIPSKSLLEILGCGEKYINDVYPVTYEVKQPVETDEPVSPKRERKSRPVVFNPELPNAPTTGFLRLKQIVGDPKNGILPIIPISGTAWWKGVQKGRYPQPVKLSAGVTAWRAQDIQELIKNPSKKWRVK